MKRGVIIAVVAVLVLAGAGVGMWEYHEQPQFCALCHPMDPYLESWEGEATSEDSGELFLVHQHAQQDVTCLECHEPTIEQQIHEVIVFVKGDYRDPLKMRKFSSEECYKCHEHDNREQLIAATADYTIMTASGEEKVNPHARTVNLQDPDNPHESPDAWPECYECHKMHRESPGIDYCFSCHHSGELKSCGSAGCHDELVE